MSGDIRTDISIISDPGSSAIYEESGNDGMITVLVKNTGSRSLDAESDQIEVLVDGKYEAGVSVTVVDGPAWAVGNVAKIEIERTLDSGDHRVAVMVNGDREVLRFRT